MVFTVDLDGRFSSINRAAEHVMGYAREEALTMRLAQVVAPEDAGLVQHLQRLADRTEVQRELVQLTIIGTRTAAHPGRGELAVDGSRTDVSWVSKRLRVT